MLQQTRVGAVIGYYDRFFSLFPTVQDLARADDETLLKAWEGLGYYSRARNLRRAAIAVTENFDGVFPSSYEALLSLPGAGAYTAGAVASIAGGEAIAAVDGNVLRILARVLDYRKPADETYKRALSDALTSVYPREDTGDFTQSFMDLGSAVCLPAAPLCDACPLRDICIGYRSGAADKLPVRKQKPSRKQEKRTIFVLRHNDTVAVRKRPDTGVLAGLWELPNVLSHLTEQQALRQIEQWGATVAGAFTVRHARHVFTHLEWDLLVFDAEVTWRDSPFLCVPPATKALPTAFRKCLLT